MKKVDIFDVIIVYTSNLANSAKNYSPQLPTPFHNKNVTTENDASYLYFMQLFEKNGITVALSTSKDVIGAGKCSSYWKVENKKWVSVKKSCFSQNIFEKFQPTDSFQTHQYTVLFSSSSVTPFIPPFLFTLFSDKQKIYDTFPTCTIPTVSITDRSKEGIQSALNQLFELIADHPRSSDFQSQLIVKNSTGYGAMHVYKITDNFLTKIETIMLKNRNLSFVIQPFINFDHGDSIQSLSGFKEYRLVYHKKKIVQVYLRYAKKGDFLCNIPEGEIEIQTREIPKSILTAAKYINKKIPSKNCVYSLDFIISKNNNVYLLEGNTNPGIVWTEKYPQNVKKTKKLMNIIVDEFKERQSTKSTTQIFGTTFTNFLSFHFRDMKKYINFVE